MRKLTKKEWIATAIGVAFVGYMFFGGAITGFLSGVNPSDSGSQTTNVMDAQNDSVKVQDVTVGTGAVVAAGSEVSVNYVLKLADGTLIQDSKQLGVGPFKFIAGAGQLIPGWEMGILGMRAGGTRIITIPPSLGYGSQAQGPIPPNSTLVFQIEVVSVENAK